MSKITYIASGEANLYTLMRDGKWLATMQFNGELLVQAQESLLAGMISCVPGQADHGSIKDRAAQLVVDMKEMADLHAGNGDTPAAEEFSQGADLVATMAAEIERLTADAERHRFARDLVTSEEFQVALEPHIEWLSEEDDPATAEEHDAVTDRVIQIAKDHGLWPFKPKRELTDEAQAERWAFEELGGCSCFNGCAPCSHCTHPGNPLNQEEDPSCWKVLP